ncbi:formylglycine-generating enzyme family protein [Umezawaea endophytica]|uniref:Formylglycine-generating enzyme family protein n=1 Tax=Umezawaea endophytica TaxID=1654476 RepID=A0A9X3A112_9PSEU|nr:formylglycine-generating enzyme family protein [Umezawaea endophytica]MCS7479114.1 formylglycine-generating enzyme family protein [Umezawaea endophytica]
MASGLDDYERRLLVLIEDELRHSVGSLSATAGLLAWDLPTFVDVGCVIKDGALVEWKLVFDQSSPRMVRHKFARPVLAAAKLQALVDGGKLDHLQFAVEQVTVRQAAATDFVPTFASGLFVRAPWSDGLKTPVLSLHVKDLIVSGQSLAIIGRMGSGKSTLLRLILRERLRQPSNALGTAVAFVNLRRASASLFAALAQRASLRPVDVLSCALGVRDATEARMLVEASESQPSTLYIDGFDELTAALPKAAADRVETALADLTCSWVATGTQVILTTRPDIPHSLDIDALLPVQLAPLFVEEAVRVARIQQPKLRDDGGLRELFDALPEEFTTIPLFASIVATLAANGHVPDSASRSALMRAALKELLENRVLQKTGEPSLEHYIRCGYDMLLRGLAALSYNSLFAAPSQLDNTSAPVGLARSDVMEKFYELDETIDLSRLATVLTRDSGLMRAEGRSLHFAHRVFQEALAAIAVEETHDQVEAAQRLLDGLVSHHNTGREVVSLYIEAMVAKGRTSELLDLCDIALDRVERSGLDVDSAQLVWLVSHIFELAGDRLSRQLRRDVAVIEAFAEASARVIARPDLLPVRDRAQIATQLFKYDDEHAGVSADGVPKVAWCPVPAGHYPLGLTREKMAVMTPNELFQIQRELPSVVVDLERFAISYHPVTWAQYRAFLHHTDGFLSDGWWPAVPLSPSDAPRRHDRHADLIAAGHAGNLPVTGVDWYEARAYCRWLSAMTVEDIDLPTEEQWESAARGFGGALYPWGDRFDPALLNWEGAGMGQVVPVGLFASGSPAPGRPADMLGNIWEWTRSIAGEVGAGDFALIGHAAADETTAREVRRVVRGGCYLNDVPLLRSSYRGSDAATSRFDRQGFRVVRNA